MDKLFTIAGTAMINGVPTLRFATGDVRVREGVLRRAGFTPVEGNLVSCSSRAFTCQREAAELTCRI